MVAFNNGDGEVAMSWIMPNQNKGCFQKDVPLEALAGNTKADKSTYTHVSRVELRLFTKQICEYLFTQMCTI